VFGVLPGSGGERSARLRLCPGDGCFEIRCNSMHDLLACGVVHVVGPRWGQRARRTDPTCLNARRAPGSDQRKQLPARARLRLKSGRSPVRSRPWPPGSSQVKALRNGRRGASMPRETAETAVATAHRLPHRAQRVMRSRRGALIAPAGRSAIQGESATKKVQHLV
jgi:hypothetical protein